MTEHQEKSSRHEFDKFKPFYDEEGVDSELLKDPGLIGFTTADGYKIYPASQFENVVVGEQRLRPHLAAVWGAYRALDEQIGEDEYTTHAVLTKPQDNWGGRSWWDVLVDPDTSSDELQRMKVEIYKEIRHRAAQDGITLRDPRTTLPEA